MNPGMASELERLGKRLHAEIIHDHGVWSYSNVEAYRASRRSGIPLVVSPRGMLSSWALKHHEFRKSLARVVYQDRILRHAIGFLATSEMEADDIRSLGFSGRVCVVPNGVDLPDLAAIGNGLDQNGTTKSILFMSRLHPKKGLDLLLCALGSCSDKEWRLTIAGADEENLLASYKQMARECNIEQRVSFVGELLGAAKHDAFRRADLFVLPTFSENFGNVIAEAMAYAVPVITTTGTPWKELPAHNCGWYVSPTLDGIHSALNEALSTEKTQLAQMGMRARLYIEAGFSWSSVAVRVQAAYEELLSAARR
jgi:glycosyltransferase involved in cell wall biosynthesis